MFNKFKNFYSFFYIELLTLIFLICTIVSVIRHPNIGLDSSAFAFNFSILGFLTIALIIYTFELIFSSWRIPSKIVNHIFYKIWFYTLLPFTIILLLLALIPCIAFIRIIITIPFS